MDHSLDDELPRGGAILAKPVPVSSAGVALGTQKRAMSDQ